MDTNFQEFNAGLEEYTARIEGLRTRFVEIGAKVNRLQGQKAQALIMGDDVAVKRIDTEVDDLQRESGNIQLSLLLLPSKVSENFHAQADELKKDLVKDYEAIQERYDVQVDTVIKSKEAFLQELQELATIRGEANAINEIFREAKSRAESLKGENEPKQSFHNANVGTLHELNLLPNTYTGQDVSEVLGVPESIQKMIYPPRN